ncbi:MAG: prepilin-type N-terminal cleavage/methylation domain-containing protein [Desulfuromonas sp.]|nr:prepilin-type N-terminal cleavage/methylation domain-containing protein [Desulfuromonas sp.]
MRQAPDQHAFTLVELCIVLFLLSLFAVISVPLFSSVGENHLNHSARRISGMVKYLYNEAALTATAHRLVFNIDQGICSPQQLADNNEWQATRGTVRVYRLPADVQIKDLAIDGQGTLTTGTATIDFHPQGWLPATTVHLQQGEKQLSVHLLPFTGTAEIEEGYHEQH